jgi:hypothetical protein
MDSGCIARTTRITLHPMTSTTKMPAASTRSSSSCVRSLLVRWPTRYHSIGPIDYMHPFFTTSLLQKTHVKRFESNLLLSFQWQLSYTIFILQRDIQADIYKDEDIALHLYDLDSVWDAHSWTWKNFSWRRWQTQRHSRSVIKLSPAHSSSVQTTIQWILSSETLPSIASCVTV